MLGVHIPSISQNYCLWSVGPRSDGCATTGRGLDQQEQNRPTRSFVSPVVRPATSGTTPENRRRYSHPCRIPPRHAPTGNKAPRTRQGLLALKTRRPARVAWLARFLLLHRASWVWPVRMKRLSQPLDLLRRKTQINSLHPPPVCVSAAPADACHRHARRPSLAPFDMSDNVNV